MKGQNEQFLKEQREQDQKLRLDKQEIQCMEPPPEEKPLIELQNLKKMHLGQENISKEMNLETCFESNKVKFTTKATTENAEEPKAAKEAKLVEEDELSNVAKEQAEAEEKNFRKANAVQGKAESKAAEEAKTTRNKEKKLVDETTIEESIDVIKVKQNPGPEKVELTCWNQEQNESKDLNSEQEERSFSMLPTTTSGHPCFEVCKGCNFRLLIQLRPLILHRRAKLELIVIQVVIVAVSVCTTFCL